MEQVKITKIHRADKDKNGKPYMGKNGAYVRLGIKTEEYGEQWLSGFENKMNANWKEGDKVTVEVESTTDGKYLNFRAIGKIEMLEVRIAKLEKEVAELRAGKSAPKDTELLIDDNDFPNF